MTIRRAEQQMPRSEPGRAPVSGWCRKELAHALLHEGLGDRALAELEAESTSYVVCQVLGLDSGAYSFGYVASWAGGGEQAVAGIRASCGRIQQAASAILGSFESEEESDAA
jgi:hypothetical protein